MSEQENEAPVEPKKAPKAVSRVVAPASSDQIMGIPKKPFFMLAGIGAVALLALVCAIIGMGRGGTALKKARELDGKRKVTLENAKRYTKSHVKSQLSDVDGVAKKLSAEVDALQAVVKQFEKDMRASSAKTLKEAGRLAGLEAGVSIKKLQVSQITDRRDLLKGLLAISSMEKKVRELSDSVDALKAKVQQLKDRMR